jgi:hypothetical protein
VCCAAIWYVTIRYATVQLVDAPRDEMIRRVTNAATRHDTVRRSTIRHGTVRHDTTSPRNAAPIYYIYRGMVRHDTVRRETGCRSTMRLGTLRHGAYAAIRHRIAQAEDPRQPGRSPQKNRRMNRERRMSLRSTERIDEMRRAKRLM